MAGHNLTRITCLYLPTPGIKECIIKSGFSDNLLWSHRGNTLTQVTLKHSCLLQGHGTHS